MTSEATSPEYFLPHRLVCISGLITCLGVVAQAGSTSGKVAGHFITPIAVDGSSLTAEGRDFLDEIVRLVKEQDWSTDKTSITCYCAPRLDGKVWKETTVAYEAIVEYLKDWKVDICRTSSTFHI